MKQIRESIGILFILFLVLIIGCSNPVGSNIGEPVITDGRVAVTSQVIIDELEQYIVMAGFTPTQAEAVISSASSGEMVSRLDSTDLYLTMPFITAGAVAGLNDNSFPGDDIRIMALQQILESLSGSLDGRKVQSESFARLIDPNADVMRAILAGISTAAVENLDTAGISADRLVDAAGATVGALVENLGDSGVTAEYISESTGDIVSAAVAGLAEVVGIDTETALAEAVQIIAENAVLALADVEITDFSETQLPEVIGSIAQGITEAIDDTGTTDVSSLIGAVTQGIAAASTQITSDPDIFSSIVEETTTGATEGLAELNSPDSTESLIGVISAQTSELFSIAAEDTSAFSSIAGDIIDLVIVGIAEGALNLDDEDIDEIDEIIAVLDLRDSEGVDIDETGITDINDLIQDGMAQADNEPPVIVLVSNATMEADINFTITATASDADGDSLTAEWSIVSGPVSHNGNFPSGTGELQTVFATPDPGEYQLKILVSDGLVSVFKYIIVTVDPSSSMLARERIDYGLTLIENTLERDYDSALIEFRKIDSSAGSIYEEALYWAAYCVDNLGGDDADALYQAIADDFSPSEWVARSMIALGWLRRNSEDNYTQSMALANAVISGYSGSVEEADALNMKGNLYLQLNDYANAVSFTVESQNHPSVSPITTYWNYFRLADIDKQEGNLSDARIKFASLLDDSTLLSSLDIYDKYVSLRWTYSTAAWVEMDNGNLSAALTIYNNAIAYPGNPGWLKSWYYSEIGWRNKQNGNWAAAESAFISAKNISTSEFSDWAMLHLAWLYNDWSNVDSSKESQILPAFIYAYNNASEQEVVLHTGIGIGEYYMWENDDNDGAITQLNNILNSGVSAYPILEARTIQRIGHAYMRKGWDADDGVGEDYIGYFSTALSYMEQITLTRFPELAYIDTWIYYEALGDKGAALQKLGRESEAISLFQTLVAASGVDFADKARFQFEIGRIHRYAADDLWWEDNNYNGAISKYQEALTAFVLVADYEENGEYVDDGQWQAEALLDSGRTQIHMGEIYEHELDDDSSAVSAYTDALDDLYLVTTGNFPALESRSPWMFYEAERLKVEALSQRNGSGDLDEALAIIANMSSVPGYSPDDMLGLLHDIARAYENIAEDYDWGLYSTEISDAYQDAIDAYNILIQESVDLSYPDGGEEAAWAKTRIGRLYLELYRRIWDYHNEQGADFSTIETEYNGFFDSAETAFTGAAVFKVDGVFPENGRPASEAQMSLAELYQDRSGAFGDRTDIFGGGALPADILNHYTMLDDTRVAYEDFLTKVDNGTWDAEDWVWSVAMQQLPRALMDLIQLSDQVNGPSDQISLIDVKTYMNRIYALVSEAGAADFMERESMASLYRNFGEWLIHAGQEIRNSGFLMDIIIGGSTISNATWVHHYGFAEVYLEQVIDNFGDIEEGRERAETFFVRANLYKYWGDFLTEDGNIAQAELYYQAALTDLDMTKTGGTLSHLIDTWYWDESDNLILEINTILAAPPFI